MGISEAPYLISYQAQLQQDFINITYVVELSLNLTDGSSLAFTRGLNFTNPTNLSQPQYDNAVTNLGTSYEKIFVNGSCTIGMVVCRSTASAGSAASQASSNPAPTPQPAQASSSSKMGSTTGAVFGTIGGLVVVAAIIGFIITRRRKRPQSASCDEAMAPIYNAHSSTTPLAMDRAMDKSFDDPEPLGATTIPQEEITLQGAIVGGDNLHSALWQDRLVVLQRFPAQAVTQRILQGAQKHAALLSTVKHPNILEFYGIAKIGGVDLSLIAESSELGSLRSVLVDANVHLDQADRLRMCLDVARALQYLHGAGRYMHMRQLTSRHVLVTDAQHRCKLDVFECQAIAASEPRVNDSFGTGTLAWTAPELLTRSPHVDQRHCNVFSLGVVMCEVLTRSLPYQNSMDAIGHTCADLSLIVRVRRGVKLEPHEHHPEFLNVSYRLRETIESCLEINPKKRPTAEAVVLELEHELHLIGAVATASFVALLQSTANAANFRCHGINYNPRNGPDWAPSDKKCKSDDAIRQDLATLKTVTDRIRLYSLTDCDQGARVIPLAKEAGFSVSVGLWVDNSTTSYQNEKAKLIELLGRGDVITNDRITDIHVGSEAVYRNDITAEENIAYMKEVRDLCRDKGVQVPVTIADIGDIYLAHDNLIDAVDFVSANGFPFWEKIEVDAAVSYMEDRMKPLFEKAKAKGKEVVISETGWASGGVSEGASKATPANAAKYFHDFYTLAEQRQWKYFYFAGFDEAWKSTNADKNDTVEAHFGLFTANRELKPEIAALTFDGKAPSPSPASSSAKPSASSGAPATGTSFQSLPRCFTQTNLSLSAVTYDNTLRSGHNAKDGLDFTEKPAKLSDTEFLQARRNLHDTALKNQISKSCSKAGVLICKKSGEPGSDSSMSKEESTARPHPEEKPEIAEPDAPGTPVANKSSSNGGSTAATVVGIVAGVFVVLAFIAFVVIRRRRSIRRSSDSPEAGRRRKGSAREIEMTPPARLPVSKVNQLPSSDVVSLGALGAGFLRFGTYKDERVVMMRLPAELTDVSDVKNLDTRATQLCSNPHAHIVTVIGITLLDSADYAVVAERMEKGTLSSVLKDEHTPLDAAARLKICLEVASGLDYLHRSVPKMYVRDLSSRKVLVNDDLVCKIDAFSCYLQSDRPSAIASFGAGTLAWIAPELVTRPASADLTACNVFALGVLMCHVLADHAPYQDAIETWGSTRADLRLLQQIKNGAKLLPHENATAYTALAPALRQLVDACLQVQPASRPTAQHVVNQLEALLQEEQL
ncbi:TPA: hypothetical protein N0F65_012123 [Lagenidium giganteum]|uniref:glucan endo-1,3-beta-D-glucosidase n=1 Tax=Lagenidium giganteum TaxID=4803 RepID=A0AAV2YJT7_9STRA|nr:TPA: hypothetical protein N0F65_012123 [Lagenidium giganteum]